MRVLLVGRKRRRGVKWRPSRAAFNATRTRPYVAPTSGESSHPLNTKNNLLRRRENRDIKRGSQAAHAPPSSLSSSSLSSLDTTRKCAWREGERRPHAHRRRAAAKLINSRRLAARRSETCAKLGRCLKLPLASFAKPGKNMRNTNTRGRSPTKRKAIAKSFCSSRCRTPPNSASATKHRAAAMLKQRCSSRLTTRRHEHRVNNQRSGAQQKKTKKCAEKNAMILPQRLIALLPHRFTIQLDCDSRFSRLKLMSQTRYLSFRCGGRRQPFLRCGARRWQKPTALHICHLLEYINKLAMLTHANARISTLKLASRHVNGARALKSMFSFILQQCKLTYVTDKI